MKKIKIETPKKFLCIVCGRIFISTSQKNYVCNECKTVLKHLSKEYENHETKH